MTGSLASEISNNTSAPTVLAAVAATLLLCLLPGYGLLRLCVPDLGRLRSVAAGPAVTAGLLYVIGQLLSLLDIAVNAWLGFVAVTLGGAATLLAERRRSRDHDSTWSVDRLLLPGAAALGTVVGAAIWSFGIGSLSAVPPHRDGMNHGYFVARIVNTGTLDPAVVLATDVLTPSPGAAYYPLALHEQAAMVVQATGVGVAAAFTLVSLICLLVSLPAGMVVLSRRIFPHQPLVAAIAGLVAVVAPGLTYSTTWWGGYAMAAGLAVSLGTLDLLLHLGERLRPATVALAALALAGVAGIHTSELPLLALAAAVLTASAASAQRRLVDAARRVAIVATPFALSLALLVPALAQLTGGYEERQYPVAPIGVPLSQSVTELFALLVFVPPPTPAAMVVSFWIGLIAALVLKRARPWAFLWSLFAVLYVWLWSFPGPLVTALTAFWYSDPFRLAYILVLLAIPFVAFALGAPIEALLRHGVGDRAGSRPPRHTVLGGVVGGVLSGLLAITGTASSVSTIRENYDDFSLIGADERRAFEYLAENARPGDRVVNQHQDGSPWMYSLYGVTALVASKSADTAIWADKLYLVRHADVVDRNPRAEELARRYRARFVYVSEALFPTDERQLSVADMRRSTAYRQVYRSGDAHVFERISS